MSKLLNKQIHLLKNDIQGMMDHNLDFEKEIKLNQLKTLTDELNKLTIEEEKTKREKEYKKVCNASDSIEYHRNKNKPDRSDILITIKDNREKAKDEFNKFKKIEEEYQLQDSHEIPGFLFFNKNIIMAYGKCPYIKIEENTFENRKRWLLSQNDFGKMYYDLYDKIIKETDFNEFIDRKNNLETYFQHKHSLILNENQDKLLKDALVYLKEYIECPIKSKKIKEKFKIVVNHFSILVAETECNISDYYSLNFDFSIPINTVNIREKKIVVRSDIMKGAVDDYNSNVNEYSQVKENIVKSKRFISNVKANLKLELYEHLLECDKVVTKQVGNNMGKRWPQLTTEERLDRYKSFSVYFVEKYLIKSNLVNVDKMVSIVSGLTELLANSDSDLIIKWNSKEGIIDKISNLKWDVSSGFFIENVEKSEKKSIKKSVSNKTILTTENEKIINEETLKFILQNTSTKKIVSDDISEADTHVLKDLKDIFIENIKIKLKLKRITVNDKKLVFDKFDEMYDIITHN